ncbi:MAG: hypothetical protein CMH49_03770 [Myxococcales bacterium]|nr:hypothetical protein [Myxococcales bacterium]
MSKNKLENKIDSDQSKADADDLARKPYQKPGFVVSRAFERQALSCAGCINQASGWPSYCSNQSG